MYTVNTMLKNITLSADADLIEEARRLARDQNKSLNDAFREWLVGMVREKHLQKHEELMERLSYVNIGRKFTREEMNER